MTRAGVILLTLIFVAAHRAHAADAPPVDYVRDVKPLLAARCYACHGPLKQQQGLRVDTVAAIRRGGDSGPAIEAHQSDDSLLVRAITGADGYRMPPEGEPLSAEQIALVRAWVDAGAPAPADEAPAQDPAGHWAFQKPVKQDPPAAAGGEWARNPIDLFLAAEHERHGVKPRPEADRATLLRRVHIDLVGLPPTADELTAFLADSSPDAYERVVDRLLAGQEHAERWARHWMDVWRYSDWYGFAAEVRNSQPHIWHWRDWIVDSLEADKGYDRMIQEMLAADELSPTDPQSLRATGFLARNWYKFNRNTVMQDTVEHTGKAFLGVTFNCARCHDHKYDPFSQAEYYQLRAFFEPYDVRADAIAGELDRKGDGLPRVGDVRVDSPTYLFVRGDEKEPDKDHPLAPALPAIFKARLDVAPVKLPAIAWYPSADPAVQRKSLDRAAAEVNEAQSALAAARQALQSGQERKAAAEKLIAESKAADGQKLPLLLDPAIDAEIARLAAPVQLAEKRSLAAMAKLLAIQSKIAADNAKIAEPPNPTAPALALAAGQAEKRHELAQAEHNQLAAEQALRAAQAAAKPDDAKSQETLKQAQAKLDGERKAVEAARVAASNPAPTYTPFDKEYPRESTGRRTALARWIASPDNPLTARVAVNHVWLRHFGQALVPTMFDFGMNGRPPSHPALLDWLAVELVEHGWSLKHLHRLIVTSAAYRLDSNTDGPADPNLAADPDNRLVWRMRVRRMEAEAVRDSLLHLAGALDATRGGPELDQNTAETTTRRSLYYRHANEKRVTFLEVFDQPGVAEAYQRLDSIVPQQSLALLNSRFAIDHARGLAQRLAAVAPANRDFVAACFKQVLGRPPTETELADCEAFLDSQARLASGATADAAAGARAGLAHVLFNHNDFVSIR